MKQKTGRRLFSFLISLTMIVGLMPGMSLTAYADPTEYPLWVGDTRVTSTNAENITGETTPTAIYNAKSNTLTLKGVNITTGHESAGIYYITDDDTFNQPLNIILEGDNSIKGDDITKGIYGDGYDGSLNFSGNGSLNATGTSIGIMSEWRSVRIDSGEINASGTSSTGIRAKGSITINGGNVEATGANYGIQTPNDVNIAGGTVTANATNSTISSGAAIYGGSGGIRITGGTVKAIGTSSSGVAYGLSGNTKIGDSITSLTVTGTTSASHGTVENRIAGMGWDTVAGTGDGTEIAVNPEGASLDTYKKLLFPYTKPAAATVKNPPTGKTLTYTGAAQELVTAGTAENGTMYYALGNDATTVPTDGWNTAIPTATDAGTYYVWYKVIGDKDHNDSAPAYVTVIIQAAAAPTAAPTAVPTEAPEKPLPKTGDNANPAIWLILTLLALSFAAFLLRSVIRKENR